MSAKPIWIDCDPGHDDSFALLLATYSPQLKILGVSVVHGNDHVEHCALNAIRFLWTCGVKGIPIYQGTDAPIIREPQYCPEIHGGGGEFGVSGLCGYPFPDDIIFNSNSPWYKIQEGHGVLKMVETLKSYPDKVTIVATGAQTNVALALRLFPEIKSKIEEIVFMGGAIGLGNTGVGAEFNIEIDPEAAHIVLRSGIPLVMIPLEVTHTVLLTDSILNDIKNLKNWNPKNCNGISDQSGLEDDDKVHPHVEYDDIQARVNDTLENNLKSKLIVNGTVNQDQNTLKQVVASNIDNDDVFSSPFAKCCYKLLTFYKTSYLNVFSFKSPPLHDPCTIFYLINPSAFTSIDIHVEVELNTGRCVGRTLCDIHKLLKEPPNVKVCTAIDVDGFFQYFFHCLKLADQNSPMNHLN